MLITAHCSGKVTYMAQRSEGFKKKKLDRGINDPQNEGNDALGVIKCEILSSARFFLILDVKPMPV